MSAGRPGEPRPLPGPKSFYLPPGGDEWRQHVSEAIRRARLVVVVAAVGSRSGRAEGTLWEYIEALRQLPPSRVVLALCGEREDYERFRAAAESYAVERAAGLRKAGQTPSPLPVLPDWPEPSRPARTTTGFPLRGVIRFTADWTAETVPFDTTAERGPTPYARWRKTERRQVTPWVAECESALPGQAVREVCSRLHWQIVTLCAGLLASLGYIVVRRWDGLPPWSQYGVLVPACYTLAMLGKISATVRATSRPKTAVRHPPSGDDRTKPEPADTTGIGLRVTEYVLRWPVPCGIGLSTMRYHRDKEGQPAPAPSGPLHRRITRKPLTAFTTCDRLPVGLVVRGRVLKTVERDAALTSRHFALRAVQRFVWSLGAVIGTAISAVITFFHTHAVPLTAGAAAIGLLVAGRSWYLHREDLAMVSRLWLRPRVPEDLAREPCVLYLRPHPDDPLPPAGPASGFPRRAGRTYSPRPSRCPASSSSPLPARLRRPCGNWPRRCACCRRPAFSSSCPRATRTATSASAARPRGRSRRVPPRCPRVSARRTARRLSPWNCHPR
ncbi:glycerol-3-phosphate acyltransferase [Streptomyces liangshanensis]|uniref:Glycerol-3-phosphate acyltransferase n=1 Tax=Streptomyces liangshanensis TaxID=2717324 RepID=A0A6G9H792_9ACTN|nr:glycerol-3-phosphate acyltransferase [Streptomyces liangshanensis]QIQ06176.1 glycerol-3-phosphate acyltransferase [Streptomyces liangshanensis]